MRGVGMKDNFSNKKQYSKAFVFIIQTKQLTERKKYTLTFFP